MTTLANKLPTMLGNVFDKDIWIIENPKRVLTSRHLRGWEIKSSRGKTVNASY